MWPMVVVEGLICGQAPAEVGEVPDEGAVQEFGPDRAVPAFLNRVHDWSGDCCSDGLDIGGGEYGIERRGELRIAVPEEELEPVGLVFEIHQCIAGHQHRPQSGGVGGSAQDPDPPAGVLNVRQDVGGGAIKQVYGEEVAGQDRFGLGLEKLGPGRPFRCGAGSMPAFFRIAHTMDGATLMPSRANSPVTRR